MKREKRCGKEGDEVRTAALLDSFVLRVGPVISKNFFQIIADCICRPYVKKPAVGKLSD